MIQAPNYESKVKAAKVPNSRLSLHEIAYIFKANVILTKED